MQISEYYCRLKYFNIPSILNYFYEPLRSVCINSTKLFIGNIAEMMSYLCKLENIRNIE